MPKRGAGKPPAMSPTARAATLSDRIRWIMANHQVGHAQALVLINAEQKRNQDTYTAQLSPLGRQRFAEKRARLSAERDPSPVRVITPPKSAP